MDARCSSCQAELTGFPGAEVLCVCGKRSRLPTLAPTATRPGSVYRRNAREVAPPPAPATARPIETTLDAGLWCPGSCPRCPGQRLVAAADDFQCQGCGGLFLTYEQLVHRIDTEGQRRPPSPDGEPSEPLLSYLRCPTCQSSMARRNFGERTGILVDVCLTHGIWFDAGELCAALAHAGTVGDRAAIEELLVRLKLPSSLESTQSKKQAARQRLDRAWDDALPKPTPHRTIGSLGAGEQVLGRVLLDTFVKLWR